MESVLGYPALTVYVWTEKSASLKRQGKQKRKLFTRIISPMEVRDEEVSNLLEHSRHI